MAYSQLKLPVQLSDKSALRRPESWTALIFGGAMIAAAAGAFHLVAPTLIGALNNLIELTGKTIALACLAVPAVFLLWLVTDRRFWLLGRHLYMGFMRWLTGIVIELNPINIVTNYLEDLKGYAGQMQTRVSALAGQIRGCERMIMQNRSQSEQALKLAHRAKQENHRGQFVLQARKAGRLNESNLSLEQLLAKMQSLYRVLNKMREVTEVVIEDTEHEIQLKKQELEMIRTSHSAMASAMRILRGDPDKKQLFDRALEYMATEVAMKAGEIEQFVHVSGSFIDSVDLQNGVYEDDALKLLETWEKRGDSLLLGLEKQELLQG